MADLVQLVSNMKKNFGIVENNIVYPSKTPSISVE